MKLKFVGRMRLVAVFAVWKYSRCYFNKEINNKRPILSWAYFASKWKRFLWATYGFHLAMRKTLRFRKRFLHSLFWSFDNVQSLKIFLSSLVLRQALPSIFSQNKVAAPLRKVILTYLAKLNFHNLFEGSSQSSNFAFVGQCACILCFWII